MMNKAGQLPDLDTCAPIAAFTYTYPQNALNADIEANPEPVTRPDRLEEGITQSLTISQPKGNLRTKRQI